MGHRPPSRATPAAERGHRARGRGPRGATDSGRYPVLWSDQRRRMSSLVATEARPGLLRARTASQGSRVVPPAGVAPATLAGALGGGSAGLGQAGAVVVPRLSKSAHDRASARGRADRDPSTRLEA
jgi:hypothetical protein